ncbi:MAG TPA: cysteine desulfurase family protein [Chitinophagales bacterium]|jgi:cysteine desulfurase|nr:cysteine desulfurase family protein [Chitinophagales bacterium]HQG37848.1 cysteine desulfurase family protein [Chitinophagales bacterium]
MRVYFDNAATTSIDTEVLEAMMPYLTEHFGNPSTQYSFGRDTRAAIEEARKAIAQLINAQPGEIVFTSGATEANNTIIKSAVNYLGVQRIITSPIEHHCVENSVDYCSNELNIETVFVQIDKNGNVDLEDLENKLKSSDKKTLVTLMHANNEIGTLLDIEKVGALCQQYHALFHSDTVQTFAHFPMDVQRMHLDFMSGAAHKFHGPKGAGFLYMRKQNKLQPLIHGGGQERGMRSGTENVYGIVGMGAAAKKAYANLAQDKATILAIKNYFIQQLKATFSDIDFNGNTDDRSLYTVLNVSFPPNDKSALLLFMLDMEGVCCSGGSACGSGASAGSHVIRALKKDENRVSIRFSFSKFSTKEEVDFVIEKLKKIYEIN